MREIKLQVNLCLGSLRLQISKSPIVEIILDLFLLLTVHWYACSLGLGGKPAIF